MHRFYSSVTSLVALWISLSPLAAQVYTVSLQQLVTPSSILSDQGRTVPVSLYAFLEFDNLWDLFAYIDEQAGRWKFDSPAESQAFAEKLLERGVESRVIRMTYSIPHEVLITHTREELEKALESVHTPHDPLIFRGEHWSLDAETYRKVFLELQERWKGSLNCWSAGPSVAERVLSNWYIIREGIELFGDTYDSTEHFWQAVKYHPDVGLEDVSQILSLVQQISWDSWLDQLSNDQVVYLAHTYAIQFLRQNLTPEKLATFQDQVRRYAREFDVPVRTLQQRAPEESWKLRFTTLEEKELWGDLADVFHLIYFFNHIDQGRFSTPQLQALLKALEDHHFDAIYLPGYKNPQMAFISPEFRELMLDIWRVKFLEMKRFREVLLSTRGYRLLHYLNDGDSPDIPIPIYVGFLEQIRQLAEQQ